jgi:hypothetical protein
MLTMSWPSKPERCVLSRYLSSTPSLRIYTRRTIACEYQGPSGEGSVQGLRRGNLTSWKVMLFSG